jgi:hypothetical protein
MMTAFCRFFLVPKLFVAGLGRVKPEVTYMKMCIVLGKALSLHRALFPHIDKMEQMERGLHASRSVDPHAAHALHPYMKGAAITYDQLIMQRCRSGTSSRKHVSCSSVAEVCMHSLREHMAAEPSNAYLARALEDAATDISAVFKYTSAYVFKRCQFQHFLASSQLAGTMLSRQGKSEASSFCLLRHVDEQGLESFQPALIQYFVMTQCHYGPDMERWAKIWKLPVVTDQVECESFGRTVFRVDVSTELKAENEAVVPVSCLIRPFILIKVPADSRRVMWRLVQFQGRLLGGCEET